MRRWRLVWRADNSITATERGRGGQSRWGELFLIVRFFLFVSLSKLAACPPVNSNWVWTAHHGGRSTVKKYSLYGVNCFCCHVFILHVWLTTCCSSSKRPSAAVWSSSVKGKRGEMVHKGTGWYSRWVLFVMDWPSVTQWDYSITFASEVRF